MPNASRHVLRAELCCAFGAKVNTSSMRRPVSAPSGFGRQLLRLVPFLLATGCGPSFEAIQEGDLRFAHCDRLDLDPGISGSHRLHCWREWRRVYTYGQTRDRVEYAQRRIAEVVSGDSDPPFELPTGSNRRVEASEPGEPNPAHMPPPAVVPLADDTSPPGTESVPPASCQARCEAGHDACAPACESQARGCQDCESTFQACLGDCKSTQK